jgi:hypothetical protein
MGYKVKPAVCSEIRTKPLTDSEHHIELWKLNLVVRKKTARLWKVKVFVFYFSKIMSHQLKM